MTQIEQAERKLEAGDLEAAARPRRMSAEERRQRQAEYDDHISRMYGASLDDLGLVDGYKHGGY